MKLREVLLRATSGKIKWWQAAELIGVSGWQISCRHANLEMVFTQRFERTVEGDNTISFHNLVMQIERRVTPHPGRMQSDYPSRHGHYLNPPGRRTSRRTLQRRKENSLTPLTKKTNQGGYWLKL
jgi:hypothetical protein